MNSFVRRILTLGSAMWDLFLSAVGCFLLIRSIRLFFRLQGQANRR